MTQANTEPMKPKFPKGEISITTDGPLKATLLCDWSRFSNGSILMTYGGGEVTEGDKVIGRVAADIGGQSIEVKVGEASYKVAMLDIFKIVQAAHLKATTEPAKV